MSASLDQFSQVFSLGTPHCQCIVSLFNLTLITPLECIPNYAPTLMEHTTSNYAPTLIEHTTGKIKFFSLRPFETTILLHPIFFITIVLYYHIETQFISGTLAKALIRNFLFSKFFICFSTLQQKKKWWNSTFMNSAIFFLSGWGKIWGPRDTQVLASCASIRNGVTTGVVCNSKKPEDQWSCETLTWIWAKYKHKIRFGSKWPNNFWEKPVLILKCKWP